MTGSAHGPDSRANPASGVHRVAVAGLGPVSVRVWSCPDPSAPPVVLVHGFMGSVEAWGALPERLAERRTVVVPDLPGHGASAAPDDPDAYGVLKVSRALARVSRALAPGPADWVGYSMGGRIVLAGAVEGILPARRLVLESTSPGLDDPEERARRREVDESRARALERDGLEAFVDAWMRLPLFASQRRLPGPVRAAERRRRLVHDPRALAACLRGGGTGAQPSYRGRLGGVPYPVLLLTGALDERYRGIALDMEKALPRATRRSVPEAGHAVHLEAPEAWLGAIEGALDPAG